MKTTRWAAPSATAADPETLIDVTFSEELSRDSQLSVPTEHETAATPAARGRAAQPAGLGLEGLEGRLLLSLIATFYTVDMTTDIEAGSGTAGDIAYVINQANANPNPAGRLIESSTPFFSTPQTITLTSTLELDEAPGRNTIAGPGADLLTISGANTVGVFEVGNTTAAFMGLTISSGAGSYGAGVLNEGMRLVTSCTITNNSIGGNGEGGGIYNTGAITITDSTVANNSVGTNGHGGDIENHGNMTITDSTIASNSVGSGGQGGIYNGDDLTLSWCTRGATSTCGRSTSRASLTAR